MNYFRLHQTVTSRLGRSGVIALLLLAGFTFVMPGVARAAGCESSHTVQAGETLTQIAQQNGLSVDALAQANDISDANTIYANQSLCLSGGRAGDGFGRLNGSANGFDATANAGSASGDSQNLASTQWSSEDNNRPGEAGPMVTGFAQSVRDGNRPDADGPMATSFGQPSGEGIGQDGGFAQSVRENANRPTDATGFGQFGNNAGVAASAAGFGQPNGDDGSQIGFAQLVRAGGQAEGFASQP